MSEFDITPNFTSDIPDVGGMVPGEFEAPEAAIDRMVGKPEPTTPRLRTPMNPEGRAPRDGMGFRENVSGAFRSGTLAGAIVESAQQEDMASGGAQSRRSGFSPAQLAQMPASVRARLSAPDPVVAAQSAQDAEDAVIAQVTFDNSKANLSFASAAGALVGSLGSPESLGGISGLLVKQFKGLASRPILTAGIDAAAVNTLTDPVVQGARMASGAQENFDPAQTAMAPVVGFALGAGVRGALELPSMARERAARQAAGQPEPLVEPAQAAPVVAAPEAAPVRETPPAATPEPARPVASAEQPRDPIAAAVDEALPELREAPAAPSPERAEPATRDAVAPSIDNVATATNANGPYFTVKVPFVGETRATNSNNGVSVVRVLEEYGTATRTTLNQEGEFVDTSQINLISSEPAKQPFIGTPEVRDVIARIAILRDNPDVAASLVDALDELIQRIVVGKLTVAQARSEASALLATKPARGEAPAPVAREAAAAGAPAATDAPAPLLGEATPKIAPHKVATPDGRAIDVTPIVVEARSLRTSADEGYDAALQPRDRDRAASQAQIREMATALDPQRLGYSAEADRGAPIVGSDGMVESGNGRIMAIRRAYDQGGEAAASYRAWVAEQGVDVSGFREPVLVRQNMTPMTTQERQQFTVAANQASTLSMSAGERAMADARAITPQMLDLVRNPDDLAALGNVDFIKAFVRGLPQTEQGALVRADGTFAAEGLSRIRNAILARAYGDSTVLTRVAEATSDDIKSISNALVSAAPEWAKLRADVDAGNVRADVDFTAELLEAVTRTADLRGKGLKLDTFLAQQDAFDKVSPPVEAFMRWFYDPAGRRAAGAPAIADKIKFYAQEARKVSADGGLDLGLAPVSARDIQALAAQRGSPNGQARNSEDLFASGGAGVREGQPARSGEASRSVADGGGEGLGSPRAGSDQGGQVRGGVEPPAELSFTRGPDGRISGVDLDKSGLELTTTPSGEMLFRKRGAKTPAQPLPPNQVMAGRPLADQATPREGLPVRVVRIEDISAGLVEAFAALGREGRVMPGAQGQYNTRSGVIRVKSIADLDTVAHEVGHSFHLFDAKPDVDAIIKANRKELEPLGAGDKTGDMEAFAELFRLFTINRPFAERSYPNATAALDELLRSKFPGQYTALDELRVAMDDLHRAPSGEVVSADTIQTEPPKFGDGLRKALASDYDPSGRTLYNAFDALYTSVIDKTHPVWKAVENLRAIGKANGKDIDVKPVDDAYILSRMLPGSHGSAGVMLEHGVIPAGGITPEGPSLGSAMEKALGKKWDEKGFADFGAYLTARRMVAEYGRFFNGEIPNPPGKFSLADYQKAVAEFDAANPTFREAAEDVYGFLNNHLKRAYDKGLFSKEYYDASISRTDYVPFVRDMADFNDPASVGEGGAPKGLRYSLMKAFKGSQRSVQNPLESIFKRVHDLEFAIAQNDAIGALARLADAAGPGSGAIAERIPSNQLRGQRVDVVEALKAAGKSANIDDADLKALILQAEDQLGDSTWATLFKQEPIAPGREPIVFHWVNGERQALRLADGRFGTELFHALNAMSDVEKNWFASILQISQQILRSGVTKAPDFILTNFIRDQFTATATSGRRYIPFISALRGVVDAVTKTDDAISYAGMGGMAGGAISDAIERAAFGKNVQALEKAGVIRNVMAGDILGAGGALLRTGAKALELSEAGTRMGLYKSYFEQAKGMGFDDLNASTYAAFKATDYIDFRKAGASMGWLRRWVPFLNAALQGTDKEFRAIGDLPVLEAKRARGETLSSIELDRLKDARVAMIRVLSLGAIVGAGLAIKNADEPDYQNAPEFTKRGNFLFKVGDVWVAIPKPFGIVQSVVNAFETAADYSVRKDPTLWGDWLEGSAKGFLPPTNNPLISLVYDLPANYNRFRDGPIVPYRLQGFKPSEQYTIGTSELSKMIGQVTGWSPMKIEYAVSNLGGSSALNLLKASDLLMGSDKPESQIYNWPVARRFVKNLVRGNQATTEFYKLVGEKTGKYEQFENAYRGKIDNGERANAAEFLRRMPEDERVWTVLQSQGFEAVEKRLHPMQNAKDRIAIIGGMANQLNFNNLIKEDDLERGNLVRSRRDAQPIALDKSTRAKLIENFQELQFISARNAMITVGAKGTAGLKIIDDSGPLDRIKVISPEVHAEYLARAETKKIYEPAATFQAWPEMKSRLVRDGETADLKDLLPAGVKPVRKKPFKVRN
jgi:hypothetical protein